MTLTDSEAFELACDVLLPKLSQATLSRGPYRRTEILTAAIVDVFEDFEGSMSTRQVSYQLVSRGDVENCKPAFDRVQRLLVAMRRDGQIPYERVVDRTRGKHQRAGWDGVTDIMSSVAEQYRRNLWAHQRTVVQVACEKQALEGIFAEQVDEYGASLWTMRGYSSESFAFEWATEIRRLNDAGSSVVIAYFGDFDPSGLDIEQDCKKKLERFGAEFIWNREGLLWEDFDRFNLVNVPVKQKDTRAKKYLERYGNRAAELDALRPDELRTRIARAITDHIDVEAWERLRRTERVERESLKLVTNNWDRAVKAAGSKR